jgi:hypothetical protein
MPTEDARNLTLVALGVMIAYWIGWMLGHQFGSRGWTGPVHALRSLKLAQGMGWLQGFHAGRRAERRRSQSRQTRRSNP